MVAQELPAGIMSGLYAREGVNTLLLIIEENVQY